jgi:hypothetical protein
MYGQVGYGDIAGQVTDPSGAVVVGAIVTATDVATGVKTVKPTNSVGFYEILDLLPGPYTVEAVAPGFKTFKREGITLNVGDRPTINLSLTLGQNAEVVSVTAEAPLLRTQDAETGEVVDNNFIMNLPQLQRDPLQLLTIAGNVQGNGSRAVGQEGPGGSDTRINGGRTSGIDYIVDGISVTTGLSHGVSQTTPGMDAVSEFKVITNGMSAEYGRASGGLVEMVTKSGSNELHGQLFEYFQNDVLNANSWEQNDLGGGKSIFRNNDFGFTLGGPVYIPKVYHGKNKTFFFANYEGVRYSTGGVLNVAQVPTAAERTGDMSAITYNGVHAMLYDPDAADSTLQTVTTATSQCLQPPCTFRTVLLGDGLHIPASRFGVGSENDHAGFGTALLQDEPLPTGPGDAVSPTESNFVGAQDTTARTDTYGFRIDENIGDNQRIFGRFSHRNYTDEQTPWFGILSSGPGDTELGAFSQTLNYDWTISPTTIFSAHFGGAFSPDTSGEIYGPGGAAAIEKLPVNPAVTAILGPGSLPWTYVEYTGLVFSDPNYTALGNSTNYEASASLTKILTHQSLKFGLTTRRYYDNFISSGSSSFPFSGEWRYSPQPVNSQICGDCINPNQVAANAFAPYLLGLMDYDPTSGGTNRAEAFNYYAAYVQDDIRVTPRLTINAGLRWDMESPLTERYNRFYFWDPNASASDAGIGLKPGFNWDNYLAAAGINPSSVPTPSWVTNGLPQGLIMLPGSSAFPGRTVTAYHPWQFAPRLGFAFQLNSKTVIRGSFAQMYITTMANPDTNAPDPDIALGNSGNGGWHSSDPNGFPGAHYINTYDDPFHPGVAGGEVSTYTQSVIVANQQATNYSTVDSGLYYYEHMPYELTESFGIQEQLPHGFLVEALYSGNQGHGLLAPAYPSQFPESLFVPTNAALYTTPIQTPFTGTGNTGAVALARMMFQNPFYSEVKTLGNNIGRSDYQSLNLRAERRLWQGITFLFNYTYAKMLDNCGGAEADADNGFLQGNGGKVFQSVLNLNSAYGYSPFDEKNRVSATFSVELPFGRGKHFLPTPRGAGQLLLDGVAGGWQFAGTAIYRSGRPMIFGMGDEGVNGGYGIEETFGSYATSNPADALNPNFAGQQAVELSNTAPRPFGQGLFNNSDFLPAALMTLGTLPPVYVNVRQPGNGQVNLSLMKKFPLSAEAAKRYLQFRAEAENAFNIRGLANYDTTSTDPDFGFITALYNNGTIAGNQERHAQVSVRIVF